MILHCSGFLFTGSSTKFRDASHSRKYRYRPLAYNDSIMYIPDDDGIIQGDSVETSGLGGIYPKGIHIGTIRQVVNTSNIIAIPIQRITAPTSPNNLARGTAATAPYCPSTFTLRT